MRRTTKELMKAIAGIIVIILALGYAGSIDYTEQVIYNMSQPKYEAIVNKLGDNASQKEIVREYTDNKEYYDTHY